MPFIASLKSIFKHPYYKLLQITFLNICKRFLYFYIESLLKNIMENNTTPQFINPKELFNRTVRILTVLPWNLLFKCALYPDKAVVSESIIYWRLIFKPRFSMLWKM